MNCMVYFKGKDTERLLRKPKAFYIELRCMKCRADIADCS